MKVINRIVLGNVLLMGCMLSAMAHPEDHRHAPCEHMKDHKMMQQHMEEHHKDSAMKAGEGKEDTKAVTPPTTAKPSAKTTPKPAP